MLEFKLLLALAILICDQGGGIGMDGGNEPPREAVVMSGDEDAVDLTSRLAVPAEKGVLDMASWWMVNTCWLWMGILSASKLRLRLMLAS